VAKQNLVVTHY